MTRFTPQWLQAGSYAASVDRRLIGALWPAPAVSGCAVTVSSGMTVNVAAGSVAVPSSNNTGSVLCSSDAVEQVTLAAAPASGTNRYDLVVCQARGNDLDGGANNDFLFQNVTGTAAATPTVPAVPANAVALAQVYVPGGSASVTAGNITDTRAGPLTAVTVLGYNQTTTSSAVIVAETSIGVNVTVNLAGQRRLRLTGFTRSVNGTAINQYAFFRIKEGATTLSEAMSVTGASAVANGVTAICYRVFAAGAHTFNLAVQSSGSGAANNADPTYPTFLLVEDMGLSA